MRVKRHKKFQRNITFFYHNFNFQPPFQILVDGTFANVVLGAKVNMKEQFPKIFEGPCKLMTTPCILIETEQLGPPLYGSVQVLKGLQLYKCEHREKPIPAASCLKSIVRKNVPKKKYEGKNDDDKFIVATQDANLRASLRELVGVPLVYLHGNAPTLEKPSDNTVAWTERRDQKKLEVVGYQKEILEHIKDDILPGSNDGLRKGTKKRKRAGPNPLSCKKSKKKKAPQVSSGTSGNNDNSGGQPSKRRKRVKLKIPKHVKELLQTSK